MARRQFSDAAMQAAVSPSRPRPDSAPSADTRIRDWMTGGKFSQNLKAGKGVRVK